MEIERASWALASRWLRHQLSRAWLPSVLVAIMAGLAAYYLQAAKNHSDAEERFAALTQRVTQGIGERIRRYEYGLRGARGVVVAAQGEITREAFSRYAASRQIDREFPGARGFGIVRLVRREQEAEFVRSMTQEFPNFWLHGIAPHDGDRFVISYVEPAERNQEAIGLDIASEATRRAAALQAAKTSEPTLTAPITLVQSSGKQFGGLLLLLPIERASANGDKALIGWSYAPLLIRDILKGLDAEESHFRLSLYDAAHDPAHAFHATQDGSALDQGMDLQRAEIRLYGRSWRVEMRPTVEFVNSLHQTSPWAEALKAALLGAVFAALLVTAAKLVDRTRGQRLEQARRAAIVEGSHDAIVVQDLDGAITDWNDGASRLFGFSREEAIGRTATRLLVPTELAEEDQALRATVVAGERVQVFETRRRAKDGSSIPVSITASPIYDDDGVVVGSAKILRDVREAKAAEQRMKDLNASLEDQVRDRTALLDVAVHEARDANEAKSRFLANVSHEIRTPMNAVIGLSHALARTRLDADQAGMLSRISTAGKTLMTLLNDVLDLSKIEAGEMTIEAAPFLLQEVVDEVCSIASVAAEQRGIAFSAQAVGVSPGPLLGDRTRLAQILLNLLSNAVKFTAEGSVVLELRYGAIDPAGRQPMQLEVRDTGIGIPPELQERLFQPFVQADASTTRKYGGTGLGLSIVRQLVELLHGSVVLKSRPGHGSTFTVDLSFPVAQAEPAAPATPRVALDPVSLAGVRVLVVDDNALNREVAERILRAEGASVTQASDGLECVSYVEACAGALDVVLMDVQMPGLDGLQATRQIRAVEAGERLPIIGLTAGVSAEERRAALDAGMDAVLGKPFDPATLAATVARLLPGRLAAHTRTEVLPSIPADWPRIDGVDAVTSFRRLKGDAALLRRMLDSIGASIERNDALLGEESPAKESLDLHRASLHDLKAIAGTIGAQGISAAAARAESLLTSGNKGEALVAMRLLSAAGKALVQWVQASQPAIHEPPADSGERRALNAAERALAQRLLRELRSKDLAALANLEGVLPGIREAFGPEVAKVLSEQVAALDFEAAERLLLGLLGDLLEE